MAQFKLIITLLLNVLLYCSCKEYDTCNLISYDDYWGYVHYPTPNGYYNYESKSLIIKDLYFNFDKGVPVDLSNITHEFLIITKGIIYRGQFNKHIEVKNISVVADDDLSSCYMIAFVLIDHTNKRVFKWYKKEVYFLYKQDEYDISLKLNGEYDLR